MQGQEIQLVSKMSRLALKHIQPPIQWVMWVPSVVVKWSGCEICGIRYLEVFTNGVYTKITLVLMVVM